MFTDVKYRIGQSMYKIGFYKKEKVKIIHINSDGCYVVQYEDGDIGVSPESWLAPMEA